MCAAGVVLSCHLLVLRACDLQRAWLQAREVMQVQGSRKLDAFSHCTAVGDTLVLEDLGMMISLSSCPGREECECARCYDNLPSCCKGLARHFGHWNGSLAISFGCGPREVPLAWQ